MTAYISGVNDPKMVTRWIAGRSTPRPQPQSRLRESYQAARLLVSTYGDETARAWFNGSNAQLEDQAPAYVLRKAKNWEELRQVVPAARVRRRRGPPMTPAVETHGIGKDYGPLVALESLTLTVEPGEVLGVLGPNGAGKTTAIRVLTTIFTR